MNFDEAVSVRVSLDSLAPALESFGVTLIWCAFIAACGIVAGALLRGRA